MKGIKINFWRKGLSNVDRTQILISDFIQATLVIACLLSIYSGRWFVFFVSFLAFVLTFLPAFFEYRSGIDIPGEFELLIVMFIYMSIFLGEVHGFYDRFWWWDVILHIGSGLALGFIGFGILLVFYQSKKLKIGRFAIAFFSFCFALSLGALWEIFEFAMDQIFGLNMQKSGLVDTMWDLIVDSVGGLIASILGYFYLKEDKLFIFDKIVKKFVKANEWLFSE